MKLSIDIKNKKGSLDSDVEKHAEKFKMSKEIRIFSTNKK